MNLKTPKKLVLDETHYVNYLGFKIRLIKTRVSELWTRVSLVCLINAIQNGN